MKLLILLSTVFILSDAWCIPLTNWCFGEKKTEVEKETIQDKHVELTNGECRYKNGKIDENGVIRMAYKEETEQVEKYLKKLEKYTNGRRLIKPEPICLCRPSICSDGNVHVISGIKGDIIENNILSSKGNNNIISISRRKRSPKTRGAAENVQEIEGRDNKNQIFNNRRKRHSYHHSSSYSHSSSHHSSSSSYAYCQITSKTINGRTRIDTVQIIKGNNIINEIRLPDGHQKSLGKVLQYSIGEGNRMIINFKNKLHPTCQIIMKGSLSHNDDDDSFGYW